MYQLSIAAKQTTTDTMRQCSHFIMIVGAVVSSLGTEGGTGLCLCQDIYNLNYKV